MITKVVGKVWIVWRLDAYGEKQLWNACNDEESAYLIMQQGLHPQEFFYVETPILEHRREFISGIGYK